MKFSKTGQVTLLSATALLLALTFTACDPVTIDYVFVAGNKTSPGQIQTFLVDRVSGALNPVNSTVSSGGVDPVSEATTPDFKTLYVANQGDSTIVQFNIGSNGVLTSAATTTLSAEGNTPVGITINQAGTLLFVANQYQPGCSSSNPCAGALAVFPIASDGTLGAAIANGTLSYWPVGINPTAVNSLASGGAVYVSSYDPIAGIGYMYGFTATSSGTLTAVPTVNAGVKPSAIASDPTSRFVYVTDYAQNQLIAYSVIDGTTLHPLINGPFKTGNGPSSILVDPRGKFIYLTNEIDNTVSAYDIDLSTGTPSAAVNTTGNSSNLTATTPVAVLVDPGFGRYVLTANQKDSSLTSFQLNPNTGTLALAPNGPYPSVGQPSALAAIPHGNHAIQLPQP